LNAEDDGVGRMEMWILVSWGGTGRKEGRGLF
jgi:hypothetical protein